MVFWITHPFSALIHSLTTTQPFQSSILSKEHLPLPKGISSVIYTASIHAPHMLQHVCQYLRTYFGDPPHTPVLDIPEKHLMGLHDTMIVFYENQMIVGTIRYHYMGQYQVNQVHTEHMYCVDCFCIHPIWRKKGLGDVLLTMLHHYANKKGIPYAMFLKEGQSLQTIHRPLYSSSYVYRQLVGCVMRTPFVHRLSIEKAYRLLDQWKQLQPHLCVIRNSQSANQEWRLYKRGIYYILACIQDTFQTKNGKRMGWVTAWLESPYMMDFIRGEASEQITDMCSYEYIWMNKEWIGDSTKWTPDGPFHWYSYQWMTGVTIGKSYCFLT